MNFTAYTFPIQHHKYVEKIQLANRLTEKPNLVLVLNLLFPQWTWNTNFDWWTNWEKRISTEHYIFIMHGNWQFQSQKSMCHLKKKYGIDYKRELRDWPLCLLISYRNNPNDIRII